MGGALSNVEAGGAVGGWSESEPCDWALGLGAATP